MRCAVLGYPIKHSKSPIIHQYWLKQHDLQGSYEAIEIHPDQLQKRVSELFDLGYDGFNVTVPHKQAVMECCDEIDETAQAIGAVNTIYRAGEKIVGTNTDAYGFIANIKQNSHFNFQNKAAFVLGAGGAARAVLYGLLDAGVSHIYLANRTREKAEELVALDRQKIKVIDWEERSSALLNIDLLINTTSLGMEGKPALDIDLSLLPKTVVVNDIVYAPLMTDLLKQAQQRGNIAVTGIGMLLHQAAPAFEKWTGKLPEITNELQEIVLS